MSGEPTAQRPCNSVVPTGTFRHTPSFAPCALAMAHDWHVGHDGVPQQVPSTQFPLTQAKPFVHALPFGFFWQVPPTQLFPPPSGGAMELQSVLVVEQVVRQVRLVASHWKLPQDTAAGVTHVPAPSHAGAG